MQFIISLERLSFTLYNSIAKLFMYLWRIVKEWSFHSNSPKELVPSLYTIRSKRSCMRLIFLLTTFLKSKNTQTNEATMLRLYKSFHQDSSLFKLLSTDNLAITYNFRRVTSDVSVKG